MTVSRCMAMLVSVATTTLGIAARAEDATRLPVADTVVGIVEYTRWPDGTTRRVLCELGRSDHFDAIEARLATLGGVDPAPRRLDGPADDLASCDLLYVGALDAADWRVLSPRLNGLALLTLCEWSTPCGNAGMFSLDIAPDTTVRFAANLDAIGRSRVRVHPQVLRLGQRVR